MAKEKKEVRVIPSKIKEVKVISEKESDLEREVEDSENEIISDSGLSEDEITPILRPTNPRVIVNQNQRTQVRENTQRQEQEGFSQTVAYSTPRQQNPTLPKYAMVDEEPRKRITINPPILTPQNLEPIERSGGTIFTSQTSKLREDLNLNSENYKLDASPKRQERKKMPWEA